MSTEVNYLLSLVIELGSGCVEADVLRAANHYI